MSSSENSDGQFVFEFDAPRENRDHLTTWRAERTWEMEKLCRRLGLPLGQEVEVRLVQGPFLRGILQLSEEALFLEAERDKVILQIDAATFRLSEIESVVRA